MKNTFTRIKDFLLGEVEFRPYEEWDGEKRIKSGFYLNTFIFNRGRCYGRIDPQETERLIKMIIQCKTPLLALRVEHGCVWCNEGYLTPRQRRQILKSWVEPKTLIEEISQIKEAKAQ